MPVKKIFGVLKASTTTTAQGQFDIPQDIPLGNEILVVTSSFLPEADIGDDTPVGDGALEILGWNTEVDGSSGPPVNFTLPVPASRTITLSSVTATPVAPGNPTTDDGAGSWTGGATGSIVYSTGVCSITFTGGPGSGDVIVDYSIDAL